MSLNGMGRPGTARLTPLVGTGVWSRAGGRRNRVEGEGVRVVVIGEWGKKKIARALCHVGKQRNLTEILTMEAHCNKFKRLGYQTVINLKKKKVEGRRKKEENPPAISVAPIVVAISYSFGWVGFLRSSRATPTWQSKKPNSYGKGLPGQEVGATSLGWPEGEFSSSASSSFGLMSLLTPSWR
ncbi:unnamed protein product [Prunus armeniaca]